MALTLTSRRWADLARKTTGAGVAVALAAVAALALATPANAHTPKVQASCEDEGTTLKVKLSNYNAQDDNILTVVADGEAIIEEKVFGTSFDENWADFDPTVKHEFVVEVIAWDDPDGKKGWSFSETLPVEACAATPPTTPEATPTTSKVAPAANKVAPTTSPASGDSEGLANTGASIAIPIVLGVLMLVGGGALLFLVRRRDSRTS